MRNKIKKIPVPVLPTMVGAMTLSNVLSGLGFIWIRPIMMVLATVVWCLYLAKMILHPEDVKKDYEHVVSSSLFPAFFMMMMLLGSFYVDYSYFLGKALWSIGIGLHFIHILIFTYRYVIKERSWDNLYPSWFVTYTGILVASVVGAPMNEPTLTQGLAYYGVIIYLILLPFQIYNLVKFGVHLNFYHTHAIMLAPVSLSFVGLINSGAEFPMGGFYFLYTCLFLTLIYIIIRIPHFFALPWSPGYAGLTFPMAIGTVASGLMSKILETQGHTTLAMIVGQIQWIQIFFTTVFVGYVLIKFYGMWARSHELFPDINN